MAQPKVFVSYSRKDHDITQRLVADLHKAGAEVWVDVDGIQSGNFMQAIDKALAKCEWMVLVLSPSALASEYVPEETYTALHRVKQGYMKGVIPVLVAACQPGSIPPQWDVLQRYDATQDYAAALAGAVRAIGLRPPAKLTAEQEFMQAASNVVASQGKFAEVLDKMPPIPPDQFPQRLANLGFTAHSDNGIEYILPPRCTVPAGPFLMGSDPKRDSEASKSEQPQHTVTLATYGIARFPVTVAEYACFVRAGQPSPQWNERQGTTVPWPEQLQRLDHPVVCVSWNDARSYASWLTYITGQSWRLPTEAEWEKAARGTDGRLYPWGDGFDQWRCNTKESGKGTTTPVGTYSAGASPCGAQDMAGNVMEWTASLYRPYPYDVADGREEANSTATRVLHGGSWTNNAVSARAACRPDYHYPPGNYLDGIGFRLVRAAPNS